jgi:hypothetical protein
VIAVVVDTTAVAAVVVATAAIAGSLPTVFF